MDKRKTSQNAIMRVAKVDKIRDFELALDVLWPIQLIFITTYSKLMAVLY
jgi:hypothetical protein